MAVDVPVITPPLYFIYTDTLTYSDSQWGDLLTSFNGTTITYDEIGNPLSYYNGSAYTFTWTGRQLTGAAKGSSHMYFTIDVAITK